MMSVSPCLIPAGWPTSGGMSGPLQRYTHRSIPIRERVKLEALAEAFNSLNRVNGLTRNGVFGTGAYPAAPLASFRQTTAVQDPRTLQIGLRVGF